MSTFESIRGKYAQHTRAELIDLLLHRDHVIAKQESQMEAIGAGGVSAQRITRPVEADRQRRGEPYAYIHDEIVYYTSPSDNLPEHITHEGVAVYAAPQTAEPVSAPKHLIERLQKHCEDKSNTAFSRSTMREALQYLTAETAKVPKVPSDAQINEITMRELGKWPSFEAQSWACKVVKSVFARYGHPAEEGWSKDDQRAYDAAVGAKLSDTSVEAEAPVLREETLSNIRRIQEAFTTLAADEPAPEFKLGTLVEFEVDGLPHKIFAHGDRPGTFDLWPVDFEAGQVWLNVPPSKMTLIREAGHEND